MYAKSHKNNQIDVQSKDIIVLHDIRKKLFAYLKQETKLLFLPNLGNRIL